MRSNFWPTLYNVESGKRQLNINFEIFFPRKNLDPGNFSLTTVLNFSSRAFLDVYKSKLVSTSRPSYIDVCRNVQISLGVCFNSKTLNFVPARSATVRGL